MRRRHSPIYYRNTLFVWGFALFALLAATFSPNTLGTLLWLVPIIYFNFILWRMYLGTHPMRFKQPPLTPADATLSYEDLTLVTADGLTLTAWYVPGKNRAAVILVHGLGGSKVLMLNHARALAFDGYGVLMIDLRAHGGSAGDTITGVHEANDVQAGVDYLLGRADVDAQRIGAVGISLGALAVLRAARRSDQLRGLVLEGMGPTCLADHGGPPKTLQRRINYPINRMAYALGDWMSGERISEGVIEALPHLWSRPVLLISAGRRSELHFNRLFFEAAREPKDLWENPRATHAAVFLYEPQEYRQRLRDFFRAALLAA
jgi:pimeloyl-ACP methyl ester carboxylesterase